ncbi:MAG TPA: glycosyltransferase family 2 protein [Phnomibacter sp.]|nr:glycosyltransferase family 2 protein [Phnomibacter sp.]
MITPAVGIGILNWNGRQYLQQFLPSVCNINYENFTIYVIDNQSTDDSLSFLAAHYPQVKVISTGGNFGVAGGYNIGFSQMPEPYLLMLNSDIEVTPSFLQPLVALMETNHNIAMCQATMLAYHQKSHYEYGGAAGGWIDTFGYTFCRGRIFETAELFDQQYKTAPVFWASGACSLIRKTAFESVGGMYPYLFMHFEEIDLCWRFHRAGYQVYCQEASIVYHVGGGSLAYQSATKTYYNFRNSLLMVWRNSSPLQRLRIIPARACLDVAAMLRYLIKADAKNSLAVIRAYGHFLKWLIIEPDAHNPPQLPKPSLAQLPGVLRQSIAWLYYAKGKKWFSQIANL